MTQKIGDRELQLRKFREEAAKPVTKEQLQKAVEEASILKPKPAKKRKAKKKAKR